MGRTLKWSAAAVASVIALVAFAAVSPDIDQGPRWMQNGMWVVPKSLAAQTTTANKVTRVLSNSATVDFASTTDGCIDSSAITVTGAQVGDPCSTGVPVAAGALNAAFTCYVSAADAAKVHFCPNDTNTGSITLSTGSGTATVSSGTTCTCTDSTANASVKCAVATTTLTATGTGSDVIKFTCRNAVDPASGTFFARVISSQ